MDQNLDNCECICPGITRNALITVLIIIIVLIVVITGLSIAVYEKWNCDNKDDNEDNKEKLD